MALWIGTLIVIRNTGEVTLIFSQKNIKNKVYEFCFLSNISKNQSIILSDLVNSSARGGEVKNKHACMNID